MPAATFKRHFLIPFLLTALFLPSCTDPGERRSQQLEEAEKLRETGDYGEALEILESLAGEFPNDALILRQMGLTYSEQGDPTMAAFFLGEALRQNPDDDGLLLETHKALEKAGQTDDATEKLRELSRRAPAKMTPELWRRLGARLADRNEHRSALEAYLNAVNPDEKKPAPETAAAIGELFLSLGNNAQARQWLETAAEAEDPNALPALLNLLEVHLREENWKAAENTVVRLEERFPGALETSEWASARPELERWRSSRDQLRKRLAARAADETEEEPEGGQADDPESGPESGPETAESPGPGGERADAADDREVPPEETDTGRDPGQKLAGDPGRPIQGSIPPVAGRSKKSAAAGGLEDPAAFARRPAVERGESVGGEQEDAGEERPGEETGETPGGRIASDPSIDVRPADPGFEVTFNEQETGASVQYSVGNSDAPRETNGDATAAPGAAAPEAGPSAGTPDGENRTAERNRRERPDPETLLERARQAESDRDYERAIRLYWRALGQDNGRAGIWNRLSRAYLAAGEERNAETAALEAIRLEPAEIEHTLDYLRVIQRSKPPEDFIAEVETAHDRFPRSPEITLTLARVRERLENDGAAARTLYRQFLDLAPNHPLRGEAENALARLR